MVHIYFILPVCVRRLSGNLYGFCRYKWCFVILVRTLVRFALIIFSLRFIMLAVTFFNARIPELWST